MKHFRQKIADIGGLAFNFIALQLKDIPELRLWKNDEDYDELRTLPTMDINFGQGNITRVWRAEDDRLWIDCTSNEGDDLEYGLDELSSVELAELAGALPKHI